MDILKKLGKALRTGGKILLKSALFLPIPFLIFNFNMASAESAEQQVLQYERDTALALLDGQPLAHADQLNDRLLLQLLVENLTEPYDTIAIGSSRILQMTAEYAGVEGSFFNCGMSGADYRDIMNTFYLFDKADLLPNNIILGLDPWILNADPSKLHSQSDPDLFKEFITLKLGYDSDYTAPAEGAPDYETLLSPATFQQNLAYSLHSEEVTVPPDIATGDLQNQDYEVKMPDGTILYPASYRNVDWYALEGRARQDATTFLRMDDFYSIDEDLCLLFHRFISYVRSRGVNIVFVMMPYHAQVYNYATERSDYFTGFFQTEPWFTAYAKAYDIPLYGSYNPFVTDSKDHEFYDGLHLRGESIGAFFPGLRQVLEQQKRGEAKSPWLKGGPRVHYEVAQRIVVERYAIPENEVVRQGFDEVINGELCYLIHRYSDDSNKPVHLATYAVSRREGVIYRWDTETNLWVVDVQFPLN